MSLKLENSEYIVAKIWWGLSSGILEPKTRNLFEDDKITVFANYGGNVSHNLPCRVIVTNLRIKIPKVSLFKDQGIFFDKIKYITTGKVGALGAHFILIRYFDQKGREKHIGLTELGGSRITKLKEHLISLGIKTKEEYLGQPTEQRIDRTQTIKDQISRVDHSDASGFRTISVLAIVFSVLIPPLGLILCIIANRTSVANIFRGEKRYTNQKEASILQFMTNIAIILTIAGLFVFFSVFYFSRIINI